MPIEMNEAKDTKTLVPKPFHHKLLCREINSMYFTLKIVLVRVLLKWIRILLFSYSKNKKINSLIFQQHAKTSSSDMKYKEYLDKYSQHHYTKRSNQYYKQHDEINENHAKQPYWIITYPNQIIMLNRKIISPFLINGNT